MAALQAWQSITRKDTQHLLGKSTLWPHADHVSDVPVCLLLSAWETRLLSQDASEASVTDIILLPTYTDQSRQPMDGNWETDVHENDFVSYCWENSSKVATSFLSHGLYHRTQEGAAVPFKVSVIV
ncbi:hypothetical protein UPYG_G00338400 [Umbra pygmaea]|uniref:Uncharacterized protein n=1 Tax=Umbra pygmaea TaxID=75934 RepID=A0ABD0WDL0_UMBPY